MLTNNSLFNGLIRIYQIPTKPNPKPYDATNFREYQKVYSVTNDSTKCFSQRPKTDLKTVKLELPPLGSEKAIVSVPVLKKNAVSKFVKKQTSTKPSKISQASKRTTSMQDLVKKLTKMEKEPKKKPDVLKTTPLNIIDNTNEEIEIAAVQLEQIQELLQKKSTMKNLRKTSPIYKLKKKHSPRIRHVDCLNTRYRSTLSSLKDKVKFLEKKYFSEPQIVYKSIHDNFSQSSDVKILYENKTYPEDLKMDQALRGIIDELDCMVKGNVEEKILGTVEKDKDSCSSDLETWIRKKSNFIQEKNNMTDKLDFKKEKKMQNIEHTSLNKSNFNNDINTLMRPSRLESQSTHGALKKKANEFDDISDTFEAARNYIPRNISFQKVGQGSSVSLNSLPGEKRKSNQSLKKKVTFVDSIPEDTLLHVEEEKPDLSEEQLECEQILDEMYKESLSSLPKHVNKEDSIFTLIDDTKNNLNEFLHIKDKIENNSKTKYLFRDSIYDMDEFIRSKKRYDNRKEVIEKEDRHIQDIVARAKSYLQREIFEDCNVYPGDLGASTMMSSKKVSKKEENLIKDNICDVIDSSEALVRKFRDIKGGIFAVGEFCDNLSRITENEENSEDDCKPHTKPVTLHEGSGDERDPSEVDEEDLPKMIKKSSFLMKEFNLRSKSKVSNKSECLMSNRNVARELDCTKSKDSNVDLNSLQQNANLLLENSIFSTFEY